jgi:5-methylcytosine-specific restriction enzyme subunit McrC
MVKSYTDLPNQMFGTWIPLNLYTVSRIIQVFEYDTLYVNGKQLTEKEFNALVRLNERHGYRYFDIGNKRIHFKDYVGVIQAGTCVIEILPKADRNENEKKKWHNGLINLLRETRNLSIYATAEANLNTQKSSLIDLYFETFLFEVTDLINKGLIKRYRTTQSNLTTLKGKLEFNKNISKNLVHKERFYVTHQVYDKNNIYNQILATALDILQSISTNHHIISKAQGINLAFEDIESVKINPKTFQNLSFNRKSEPYKKAITLAKMIILHFSPTLHNGQEDVIAFLFEMFRLFESYVFLQMKKVEQEFESIQLSVENKTQTKFWQNRPIRPDIILDFFENGEKQRIIVDTKWKIINDANPSEKDLKQIFAYNIHFGATKSVLLYPKLAQENTGYKKFEPSVFYENGHSCQLMFVNLLEEDGRLRKEIGRELIEEILGVKK